MSADSSLQKAAERLGEISTQIEVLQQEAREIETALAVMRRFGATLPSEGEAAEYMPQKETVVPALFVPKPRPQRQPQQGMSQTEFEILAARLIEDAAGPLTRTAILARFAALGKSLGDGDAGKNAGTKLWRARKKFVNIRGAGYWLRDRPCPALGYMPGISELEEEAEAARNAEEERLLNRPL